MSLPVFPVSDIGLAVDPFELPHSFSKVSKEFSLIDTRGADLCAFDFPVVFEEPLKVAFISNQDTHTFALLIDHFSKEKFSG
jgi:hypothetical protein